ARAITLYRRRSSPRYCTRPRRPSPAASFAAAQGWDRPRSRTGLTGPRRPRVEPLPGGPACSIPRRERMSLRSRSSLFVRPALSRAALRVIVVVVGVGIGAQALTPAGVAQGSGPVLTLVERSVVQDQGSWQVD